MFSIGGTMKVYETISADNWRVVSTEDEGDGKRCLLGHLARVYGPEGWGRVRNDVMDAIDVLYPERMNGRRSVALFNDHLDTRIEDIIRVCKLADV